MFNTLFNMWLDGVKIIISFIIGFDLITFSLFGDRMLFAQTFLPKEKYEKLYDYLNKKGD